MILSESEIKEIIEKNPNKALVVDAKKISKDLRTHIYGENLEAVISKVDGFESETLKSLRLVYAKSNRDLMSRMARPIDKIFSAKGGSIYYNLPDTEEKKARNIAKNIRGQFSIKAWIENFWLPHFLDDPCGMIFMEVASSKQAAILKLQNKSLVYPTYKSIYNVYDYLVNGSYLEYVVFALSEKEKKTAGFKPEDVIYRVIDDAADYYVKLDNGNALILDAFTIPNLFEKVPAILNSDMPMPNKPGLQKSLFTDILELANHFLVKGSIKVTHEFMHAFPKYWEYADDCPKCHGSKFVGADKCEVCKGTGKNIMSKVSDVKLLSYPQTKEDATVTPNVAGYVEPSKTFHEIATADLHLLEDVISHTLWGSGSKIKTSGLSIDTAAPKTATEVIDEIKPQSDRLVPISEMAEKRHKFILDYAIQIQISQNYTGSSVNYGKRYMIEGPDVIWDKYSNARKNGASISTLDDLLTEYYETKYSSDPIKLAILIKMMKIEPFIHNTISEVKNLMPAEEDYKAKLYFSEWIKTNNEAMLIGLSEDLLRSSLLAYVAEKILPQPAATKAA